MLKKLCIFICLILTLSTLSITQLNKQQIKEKKVIEITIGGTTIRYEVVDGKIVRATRLNEHTGLERRGVSSRVLDMSPIGAPISTYKESSALVRGTTGILFSEDFEYVGHDVPGQYWKSIDYDNQNGYVSWADGYKGYYYKTHGGRWSMWCAGLYYGTTISGSVAGDGLPAILVVDDNNVSNPNNYLPYYTNALDYWNYQYDTWVTRDSGIPSLSTLLNYDIVIWFTGDDYSYTLTAQERNVIGQYLDNGKSLFINGQDIGYDVWPEDQTWYQNYLKAIYKDDDSDGASVTGVTGTAFEGDTYTLNGSDSAQNSEWPSEIDTTSGSNLLFYYDTNTSCGAAIYYDGDFKLVYFAFPFEATGDHYDREIIMYRVIESYLTPNPRYDIGDNDTDSWWGIRMYLSSGVTYNFTLDWDTTEDLDLIIYDPSGNLFTYATTENKPETVEFTASETGWWYLCVDDFSEGLGVVSAITITVNKGGPIYMKKYYTPRDMQYSNYMESVVYRNSSFYPVADYDLVGMEFWGWWELEDSFDKFWSGFYLPNGTKYVAFFSGDSNDYSAGSTQYEENISYRIIERTADGWLHVGILADKDWYYDESLDITAIFGFSSDYSVYFEGAYVDDISLYYIDITLDDWYINTTVAHPGEDVLIGWYVDNPSVFNITEFNLTLYLRHVDTGNIYYAYMDVAPTEYYKELKPGAHWFYGVLSGSSIANLPTGYYDIRYVVWRGNVEESIPWSKQPWGDSNWIYNGFQIKHYTSVSFSQSQYSGYYGDGITITGSIQDSSTNNPLSGKDATLYYYDGSSWVSLGTATSNTNGDLQWPITLTMDAGTYDLKIEFKGDDYYEASSTTLYGGLVVNPEITQITFDQTSYTVDYKDTITISCVLKDDEGNALSGQTVDFYYSSDGGTTWTYWFTETTDTNGRASRLVTVTLDPGSYYLKASFLGTKNYQSSSAQVPMTVDKESTQLTLGQASYTVNYGDQVVITATLEEEEGSVLSGEEVWFDYWDGSAWAPLGSAITDTYGVATLPVTITLTPGTYSIRARYDGSKYYYSSISGTGTLTVNKEITQLTDPSNSGNYSDEIILTSILKDDEGNPIDGKTIYFKYYDGTTWYNLGSNVTDKDGKVILKITLTMQPASYTLRAEFSGDTYYEATYTDGTLTVYKEQTSVEASDVNGNYSDSVTFTATLIDNEKNPIGGKAITFEYYDGSAWVSLGSANTGSDGVASLSYTLDMPSGVYQIRASFAGDSYYVGCVGYGTLTVNKEQTCLSDPSTSGNFSDSILISTILRDNDGVSIGGKLVLFNISEDGKTWEIIGQSNTNASGYATLYYTIDKPSGSYILRVYFEGDEYYAGCIFDGTLIIYPEPSIISLGSFIYVGNYSDTVRITATLHDHDDGPIGGRILYFNVSTDNITWIQLGWAETLSNGTAILDYKIDVQPANYTLRVYFEGDEYYSSSTGYAKLVVNKEETMIINVSGAGAYGENATLRATLLDNDNVYIGGSTIIFEYYNESSGNWVYLANATTNNQGVAEASCVVNLPYGNYSLRAIFNGDDYYVASSGYGVLEIGKEFTILVLYNVTGKYLDTVDILALLTDDDKPVPSPVENVTIVFMYFNGSQNVTIGQAVTNSSGYASINFLLDLDPGVYTIYASFGGNEYYRSSEDQATMAIEKLSVIIDTPNVSGNYTDFISISLNIVDEKNRLFNGTVYLEYSNGTKWYEIASNLSINGVVIFSFTLDIEPSNYLLRARNEETQYNYGNTSEVGSLNVYKEYTEIYMDLAFSGNYSDELFIVVTLKDDEGDPIQGIVNLNYSADNVTWYYWGNVTTNASGIGIFSTLIDLKPGNYTLVVYFDENQYYAFASKEAKLTVNKEQVIVIDVYGIGRYGDPTIINATLTDNEGVGIENQTIIFLLNNTGEWTEIGNATTDSKGYASLIVSLDLPFGNYTIKAVYQGSEYYTSAETLGTLLMEREITIITVYDASGKYLDVVSIVAKCTDDDPTPSSLSNITIRYMYYNGTINVTLGHANTNNTGFAVLHFLLNITPGNYKLYALFDGNEYYYGSSAEATLLVQKLMVSIETPYIEGNYSDMTLLYIYIVDEKGNPYRGKVYIEYNDSGKWVSWYNATTNESGYAVFYVYLDLIPGIYQLRVHVPESEYYLEGFSGIGQALIYKEYTLLSIIDVDSSFEYSDYLTISVNLTDDEGIPIFNKTIILNISGQEYHNTTSPTGLAEVSFVIQLMPGEYNLSIISEENQYYRRSECSMRVHILKEQTNLLISAPDEISTGSIIEIAITIKDNDETPIKYANISLYMNDTLIGWGLSDDKGNIVFNVDTTDAIGNYVLMAFFSGNSTYLGASIQKTIKIVPREVIMMFGASEYKVNYSDPVKFIISLRNYTQDPIPNIEIKFYIETPSGLRLLGTNLTDSNGIATYLWLANETPGEYVVYAECVGLDQYNGTMITSRLIINQEVTYLIFYESSLSVEYTDNIVIVCYLRTNDGEAISRETVDFYYFDGGEKTLIGSDQTDEDGKAQLVFDATMAPGTYSIIAEYQGSACYKEATKSVELIVRPEEMIIVNLKIFPEEVYVGDKITIELVVAENDYDATRYIANANVTIMLDGEKIASGYTDNNGKFTGEWTPDKSGEFEMKIVIEKQNYETFIYSIKRTVKARVKYLTYLLLAIAAISTTIIAIVVKRKHRVEGEFPVGEVSIEEMEELEAEPLDELE